MGSDGFENRGTDTLCQDRSLFRVAELDCHIGTVFDRIPYPLDEEARLCRDLPRTIVIHQEVNRRPRAYQGPRYRSKKSGL